MRLKSLHQRAFLLDCHCDSLELLKYELRDLTTLSHTIKLPSSKSCCKYLKKQRIKDATLSLDPKQKS